MKLDSFQLWMQKGVLLCKDSLWSTETMKLILILVLARLRFVNILLYTLCILACFFYVTSILHAVAATSSIISALVFLPLVSLVFLWVLFLPLHELENCVVCTIRGRYGAMGLIYSEFHSVLYCEQLAFRKRTPFCF